MKMMVLGANGVLFFGIAETNNHVDNSMAAPFDSQYFCHDYEFAHSWNTRIPFIWWLELAFFGGNPKRSHYDREFAPNHLLIPGHYWGEPNPVEV